MRRTVFWVHSRGNWHMTINSHIFSVLIGTQSRQMMLIYNGSLLNSLNWIIEAHGTTLTGWCRWLVLDSRPRRTIWTFKLLTALFVSMPAHYLYVKICDLILLCLRFTLTWWQPLNKSYVGTYYGASFTVYYKKINNLTFFRCSPSMAHM